MYQSFIKGSVDAIIASIALISLLLPLVIVAIVIKIESRGPVLFRQQRFGKDKVPFTVYKFRSMAVTAPSDAPTNSLKDAQSYITRVGKVIRKLSIDELPQLINVVRGDMSLIGPRPVILKETRLIELRDMYNANSVRPGITGWAQVNGRDEISDDRKSELDGVYVSNIGPYMDLTCLIHTVWAVLALKGNREGGELPRGIMLGDTKLATDKR